MFILKKNQPLENATKEVELTSYQEQIIERLALSRHPITEVDLAKSRPAEKLHPTKEKRERDTEPLKRSLGKVSWLSVQ